MNCLLVEPQIKKSWGHNNQFVGLLRIANWLKSTKNKIVYVRHPDYPAINGLFDKGFYPDEIYVSSMFTYSYKEVWETVRYCRENYPKAKINLGGIYATICPEHARQSGADEIMIGRHSLAKDYPPDPSILPYKQDFAYLFSSYGCNRACTYCATHILFGKGITQTHPDKVINEIKFLISHGFKNIWFGDDNLMYNAENHINIICEKIIQEKIKVNLKVPGGISAKDFSFNTAKLMKQAGFTKISFAIESTADEVRKKMGRKNNVTQEDLIQALEYCDKVGFNRGEIDVYFIIGLPYQKIDDMVDTLVFLIKCGVWAHPQRLTPIPHTIDWKRMNLENWDLADLYYKTFVAPNQDNFTHIDLETIYKIARFFNIGQRYSSFNWLLANNRVTNLFQKKL